MRRACAALFVLVACNRGPDLLAEQRQTCAALAEQKALRAGLSVEDCARELKARADLDDPARKATELLDRITRLVGAGHDKPVPAQQLELKDAISALQNLGRPAVEPTLARLKAAKDADLRLALARPLVSICADDCAAGRYDCIVPALLEGTRADLPSDVRVQSETGLTRCTGEAIGDDPAGWARWWAGRQAQASNAH